MELSKLAPILNKESILKTANAGELKQAPQDVRQRYEAYALTHVPLGDTSRQLANLQRVVTQNKTCAMGTIVGPYGYGKTSTAVHLWNELRQKNVLAVPPFLWNNLQDLVTAVYYWVRFEFEQGPAKFVEPLDKLFERYAGEGLERLDGRIDPETARELWDEGLLNLQLRSEDVVEFYSEVSDLCLLAGYGGLAVFTDELQATVADYKPSRDQFFNDLFGIVKDTLGRPGNWALIMTMDDGTEGIIQRMRADLLQRMQRSALYFRVDEVYNRREYPAELWAAFAERFGFDGSLVILPEALTSIGEIASRPDLGAGPRMVTYALSLAVKYYEKHLKPYTPLLFVDDFLEGLVVFDQSGKFPAAVKKALDLNEVRGSEANQQVVKLLAAYPAGCPEEILERFDLLQAFRVFPPLARRELIVQLSEGHTIRYLLEQERPPERVEQRLTQEFVARFMPDRKHAQMAAEGFLDHILVEQTFDRGWKSGGKREVSRNGTTYKVQEMNGTFDARFPERKVTLAVAAVPQSAAPEWEMLDPEADLELRYELNYNLSPSEPSQLLIAPDRPQVAVFQLNMSMTDEGEAHKILPELLFEFYSGDRLTPLLALALTNYMFKQSGELPEDINRVRVVAGPLRQYALTLLLGQQLQVSRSEFESSMVGHERIRDLFKTQCTQLFPDYKTLITGSRWQQDLQQYNNALERVVNDDGVSVARGRRPWETTKEAAADAFAIPKRSLTRLETLLDGLQALIVKEDYSGRQADSPIRLRFALHPLESHWLELLDESTTMVDYNGLEASALSAIELLREGQAQGYRLSELQEIMRVMQTRQFVAYDERKGLLVRAVDAVDDLRAAVTQQFEQLQASVEQLEANVTEFDASRLSLREMKARLGAVTARDELEILKNDVRRTLSGVLSFARSRAEQRRGQYVGELGELQNMIHMGVPGWLGRPFTPSPLQTLLEQHRQNVVGAYESTLREMRALNVQGNAFLKELPNSPIESLLSLQKEFPNLKREADKLHTRLRGFSDQQSDLDAWRSAVRRATDFESKAQGVSVQYDNDKWQQAARELWKAQEQKMVANPLNIPGLHRDLDHDLEELETQLTSWLENRREDFEGQRRRFELAFADLGIAAQLRIPFDQQNPADSYAALGATVQQLLAGRLKEIDRSLNQTLQRLRYAEHIQQIDLSAPISETTEALASVERLGQVLSPELLRDVDHAEESLLQPMREIVTRESALADTVRNALQKRELSPEEARLQKQLQAIASNGDVDLYSLIMRQLHDNDEATDLDQLLGGLQSLFQKNQVGIRIRLL